MSTGTLVERLTGRMDKILGIRDKLGAEKHKTYILTRVWSGDRIGDGFARDSIEQILPSPCIIDFSHDRRVQESGNFKRGDIILDTISKQSYPNESDIDCTTGDGAGVIEKFYYINNRLYTVINVREEYTYWAVQVRKHNKQATYFD